jgi:hypothetical protein
MFYTVDFLSDDGQTVTVQTCYSSPWTRGPLQSYRKGDWFIGETDLLACYDLFFRIGRENNCLVLFASSLDDRNGTRSPREAGL